MTATRPATAPEMMPSTRRLLGDDPFDEHPGERRRGGGNLGVEHGGAGKAVGSEFRAGVEAEPADPQQRSADHRIDEVVRRHVGGAVALALAENERADETRDTGVDVHDGAAGEVEHAEQRRGSRRPRPNARSGSRRRAATGAMKISSAENFMRSAKAPPISAGRDDGEGHLEHREDEFRNVRDAGQPQRRGGDAVDGRTLRSRR